jgi:c-di-GMP-binding flagellar brake protein YcgR
MNAPVRRFKRVKLDIRVKLRRWEDPEEAAIVVRTFEMSEGGMSVYASVTLDVDTDLATEFTLPGSDEVLKVRASVRNRRGFRCGVEFVNLTVMQAAEIRRFLGALDSVVEI